MLSSRDEEIHHEGHSAAFGRNPTFQIQDMCCAEAENLRKPQTFFELVAQRKAL
jgi:hypothetical protein